MEIRSAMTGKIRAWLRPTPLKAGLGASVAAHAGLLATTQFSQQTAELVANYPGTVALTAVVTLTWSGKAIYKAIREGTPLDSAKLMSWSERVRAENLELKQVASSALSQFEQTGKSDIDWGNFIPRAELNNDQMSALEHGSVPRSVARLRDGGWERAMEKCSRKIGELFEKEPRDPLVRFQKAYDYLSQLCSSAYKLKQGALYGLLEGKGGNCDAKAKLVLALADRVCDWSRGPWQPALAQYSDHSEIVLINKRSREIYDPTVKRRSKEVPTAVYNPHVFVCQYLEGAGAYFKVPGNLLLAAPVPRSTEAGSSGLSRLERWLKKNIKYGGFSRRFMDSNLLASRRGFFVSWLVSTPVLGQLLKIADLPFRFLGTVNYRVSKALRIIMATVALLALPALLNKTRSYVSEIGKAVFAELSRPHVDNRPRLNKPLLDESIPVTLIDGETERSLEELGKALDDRSLEAVDKNIAALKDANLTVREKAAYYLGIDGNGRAIEPLIAVLKDSREHPNVRGIAAASLGAIRDKRAYPALMEVAADDNVPRYTRLAAMDALGAIGDNKAVDWLIGILKDKQSKVNRDFRREAVVSLQAIGDKKAIGQLLVALNDDCSEVRETAVYALGELAGVEALKPLKALRGDGWFESPDRSKLVVKAADYAIREIEVREK